MFLLHINPVQRILAYLSLSIIFICGAQAQPASPAKGPGPTTLRLAQVVPRLPTINFYAISQDEGGRPVPPQSGTLSALIGSHDESVESGKENGIGIVFLIDVSASLNAQQFAMIQASVRAWIDSLGTLDRAAIVTLGSSINTVQDFTDNKNALIGALMRLAPHDQQTLLYQGIVQAIDLSRRLDSNLPLRRAIVVLTDGMDDQQGGAGRQEVIDKLAVDPTPIYGIGASSVNNAKVDAALKDFAGVVRMSGGDFKRIGDIRSLDSGYRYLHGIVESTQHFTAKCNDPPCTPDGSAAVVRLFMSQNGARLSSESLTVRLVGAEGKPIPPSTQEPWFKRHLSFFLKAPLQWSIGLALVLAALAGAVVAYVKKPWRLPPEHELVETKGTTLEPAPVAIPDIGVVISGRKAITSGTRQDKQRLRLYPIGRNDIGPWDLDFDEDVKVGRSPVPEMDISIYNDGQVSASHCTLSPKGKSILVRDAGSRNGTRVNGVPINGFMHAEADSILGVGRTELRMKLLPAGAQ
jgi:hypothetical protein